MASFHVEVKSGRKGVAADHAKYIARKGYHERREDLIMSGHGNMPSWSGDDPATFWCASDKYERANGSAYREFVIGLPNELNQAERGELADHLVSKVAGRRPYEYAVHAPKSSIQGEVNTHLHLMMSDRLPDGIERPADRMFARYNPNDATRGGRRKDSGGRNRLQVRDELIAKRKQIADIINAHLVMGGYTARVDHRTLRARGITRKAERHLGPAEIKRMSDQERAQYVAARERSRRRPS